MREKLNACIELDDAHGRLAQPSASSVDDRSPRASPARRRRSPRSRRTAVASTLAPPRRRRRRAAPNTTPSTPMLGHDRADEGHEAAARGDGAGRGGTMRIIGDRRTTVVRTRQISACDQRAAAMSWARRAPQVGDLPFRIGQPSAQLVALGGRCRSQRRVAVQRAEPLPRACRRSRVTTLLLQRGDALATRSSVTAVTAVAHGVQLGRPVASAARQAATQLVDLLLQTSQVGRLSASSVGASLPRHCAIRPDDRNPITSFSPAAEAAG